MTFWMGIYQTAMREGNTVSGCDTGYTLDFNESKKSPGIEADRAVHELRRRLEPPQGQYHNSPKPE